FLPRARRNSRSTGFTTPRHSAAMTTAEFRMTPFRVAIRCPKRPVRISSTRTDVSKMMTSLIETAEGELAFVLLHQSLEALQRDQFTKRDMDGFSAGLYAEKFFRLVGQFGVQADRCHGRGHRILVDFNVYTG